MRNGSGISKVDKNGMVMVLGKVEDTSESMTKDKLYLVSLGEERFLLRSSSDVGELSQLSDKRVTVLGTIDRTAVETPILTVFGYRTLPTPVMPDRDTDGPRLIPRKR